jgi:hypothetical protein
MDGRIRCAMPCRFERAHDRRYRHFFARKHQTVKKKEVSTALNV